MKKHTAIWLAISMGILFLATATFVGIIQGPVKGTVVVESDKQMKDILVKLQCKSSGLIHNVTPSGGASLFVLSGREFIIPWAYRGLVPHSCTLRVFHPLYVPVHLQLGGEFSHQIGDLLLISWEKAAGEGEVDPALLPSGLGAARDFEDHLKLLENIYYPAVRKGDSHKPAGWYLPALENVVTEGSETGLFGPEPEWNARQFTKTITRLKQTATSPP